MPVFTSTCSDFVFKQPAYKQESRLTKTRETSDSLNSGHPNRFLIQKLLWNVSHDLGNGLYQEWIDLYRKQLWYHFFSDIEMRSTLKLHLTPTMVFHPTYQNNNQYSHHVDIYRCIWSCLIFESCQLIKIQDKWGSLSLKNINKTLESLPKKTLNYHEYNQYISIAIVLLLLLYYYYYYYYYYY